MIVLHIGLVKTGTTLLQYQVFRNAPGLKYMHRKTGKRALRLTRALRTYVQAEQEEAIRQRRKIVTILRSAADGAAPLLVSDENVGVGPRRFWAGTTATPALVARRLRGIRARLAAEQLPLKVVLGIRRQDRWLGSSYAQYSENHPDFCQVDFDARMQRIAAAPVDEPSLLWLDYRAARAALTEALGGDNVLVIPLERLSAEPAETLGGLAAFLGGADLLGARSADQVASAPRNQLGLGGNAWTLRSDRSSLELRPDLEQALRARFAESNRALAAEMPLGFEP